MTCKKIIPCLKIKKNFWQLMITLKNILPLVGNDLVLQAVLDQNGYVVQIFDKFFSCRLCHTTYSFKSNSTSHMNKHSCINISSSTLTTNSQSLKQWKLVVNDTESRLLILESISLRILFYRYAPVFICLQRFYRIKPWKYFSWWYCNLVLTLVYHILGN